MKRSVGHKLILGLTFLFFIFGSTTYSQTPSDTVLPSGGGSSLVYRFTKQVWLNPSIILLKQHFEEETHVKLLLLPRLSGTDTSSNKLEKAFDKVLSFLVYKESTEGSIKFYFDPKNKTKPFSFGVSEELWCKFSALEKDTVEQLLNSPLTSSTELNDFGALPFDEIIGKASDYCKKIVLLHPASCGTNPENEFSLFQLNCVPARVTVEKIAQSNQKYNGAVDEQKYPALSSYYNTIIDLSDKSNYPVAWKALAVNENDVIRLKVTKKEKDFSLSRLVFKNATGTETYKFTLNKSDSTILQLQLTGKPAGSMVEVVATYTNASGQTYAVGAFNVQFYAPETYTVVLVNTGNATINVDAVKQELNRIYGSVFINWEVKVADKLSLPSTIKTNIHIESSGLLSNYMPDMKPVINYFKNNSAAYSSSSTNTCYLLLGCTNDDNLGGYMPRLCNIGFIFDNTPHIIAHELGHGAFGLKHIFNADELGEGYHYQTDNVMDYAGNGTTAITSQNALYKHQWDLIHNPDFVGWFEGDDEEAGYETDGHYSTVYLVCLMLGMDQELARQLAVATEDPDTDVHSEMDFELDQTWIYYGDQQEIHSLTGGFHSVEEMMTAFKFIYISKNDIKGMGQLLHRYGDTYAHTRLDNFLPADLKDYEFDSLKLKIYIAQWKDQKSPPILDRIAPWVKFLNYQLNLYGYKFLTDETLQKKKLGNKNLVEYLHDLYPNQPVDKFIMYGEDGFTFDHFKSDKGTPDFIFVRPKWYLSYVENLATLINYKFNNLSGTIDIKTFEKMIAYATANSCTLKGIIDYEIAKKRGVKSFYVPVFYSNPERIAASADAIALTNYLQIAKNVVQNTRKYLQQQNIIIDVEEIQGNLKVNSNGTFTTLAFKITLK